MGDKDDKGAGTDGGAGGRRYSIAIIGDSLSSGFNASSGFAAFGGSGEGSYRYSDHLGRMLAAKGWNVDIDNRAVPGVTSSRGPDVAADLVKPGAKPPDVVILALGGNDLLQHIDPEKMRKNLEDTITTLRAKGVQVMIAGMKSENGMDPDYRAKYDAVFADLAKKYDLVIDPVFVAPMVANPDGKTLKDIFKEGVTSDGMHPNAAGAKLIAGGMEPEVEQALQRVADKDKAPAPATRPAATQPAVTQ